MVHLFSQLGQNIALDVESGAVHVLDKLTYDMLQVVKDDTTIPAACPDKVLQTLGKSDEVHEAWSELHELFINEQLLTGDKTQALEVPTETPLKALCLHVAHDCNLRCAYCFAETGDFGAARSCIDFDTAKQAIDFLIARSGARRNLEVDFFGGEPLMAIDVVRKTVSYARSLEKQHGKHFRFTLTTNGVLLDDEIIEFLNAEMSNIVLSLDGRREINDKLRKTTNHKGSYDVIVPKFQQLVSKRVGDYFVRGTFTSENPDFVADVKHLATLGFRNISIEPVVLSDSHPLALREEHIPIIMQAYETLAEEMSHEPDFHFFHFAVDMNQGPCVYKRLRGCGAGFEYAAVTPEGGVYPCHQFAGRPEFHMGNVFDNTFDAAISEKFSGKHIHIRTGCNECWAKYYCSGGCAAANLNTMGALDTPYELGCRLEKKRLECAIALAALKSQAE